MKLSNLTRLLFAGTALSGILSSCRPSGDGKIPVNEEQAAQHIISASRGEAYIKSFKAARMELGRVANDSFLSKQFQLPVGESFNRDAIAALLNANGAVGIRIYLGRDDSGLVRMVLAPIDKNGADILTQLVKVPATSGTGPQVESLTTETQLVDIGQRCPTLCDSINQN
jgi:hypothetical protein